MREIGETGILVRHEARGTAKLSGVNSETREYRSSTGAEKQFKSKLRLCVWVAMLWHMLSKVVVGEVPKGNLAPFRNCGLGISSTTSGGTWGTTSVCRAMRYP